MTELLLAWTAWRAGWGTIEARIAWLHANPDHEKWEVRMLQTERLHVQFGAAGDRLAAGAGVEPGELLDLVETTEGEG